MSSVPEPVSQAQHLNRPVLVPAASPVPAYSLFDSGGVTLATFFGTPVAGAVLMFVNDKRLGRTGRGVLTLLAAIVVTALASLVGWSIPLGGSAIFALGLVVIMRLAADKSQGKAVAEHVQRGGKLGSKWEAVSVGLAFLGAFAGLIYVVSEISTGPKIIVGTKDEIYYTGTATKDDATALGNGLKASGYLTDRGVTVLLDKGKGGTVVSFIVKEGAWDQPDTLATFDEMGRELAPSLGGFPIEVRLLDKERNVKSKSTVGKLTLGNDHIYYLGSVTEAQAQALGNSLKTQGFFDDKGVDVFVSRRSDGTALSFIVADGVWNDASMVATFEKIARDAAPAVGGLPIHLRLENSSLEVKKDEELK
jgi:hypothetical protein